MSFSRPRPGAFFLLLALLAGCTHAPPRQPTGLTAAEFWKEQATRKGVTAAFSAKLKLRYEAHKEGISGKGRLLAQAPGGFRLELRDPLGRVQYLVTLSGQEFAAYYPTQKRAYTDRQAGTQYMKRFLGFPFSFRDLESLLVGVLPPSLAEDKFDSWGWVPAEGVYRGVAAKGGAVLVCDVDPDTAAIRSLRWESGRETATVTYGDFSPCCGGQKSIRLGDSVSVALKQAASKVEAEWDDIAPLDIAKGDDVFKLAFPPDVRHTALP